MERNPFSAKNQTLRSLQSIYFAYDVGIISSYSNIMLIKTFSQDIPIISDPNKDVAGNILKILVSSHLHKLPSQDQADNLNSLFMVSTQC